MESEKKNKRAVKRAYSGAVIQYRSTRMPLIEEIEVSEEKTLVYFFFFKLILMYKIFLIWIHARKFETELVKLNGSKLKCPVYFKVIKKEFPNKILY